MIVDRLFDLFVLCVVLPIYAVTIVGVGMLVGLWLRSRPRH